MNHRDCNIFYKLVRDKEENPTTELFCNLLRFERFRDAVLELFLEKELIDKIKFKHCKTQDILLHKKGRPDLIIRNKEIEIVFEIKITNASLTPNQPRSYLEYLSKGNQKTKWLIFLIPESYTHEEEWGEQCAKSLERAECSGIQTKIIKWPQVIKKIEEYNLPNIHQGFNDFVVLLKKWFEIHFAEEEVKRMFSAEIPKAMMKLCKIVDHVSREVDNRFNKYVTITRNRTNDAYGYYFVTQNKDRLWFGIWYSFWDNYNKPLCFCVHRTSGSEIVEHFKQLHQGNMEEYGGYYNTWINEDIFKEDECWKHISLLIADELEKLLEGFNIGAQSEELLES